MARKWKQIREHRQQASSAQTSQGIASPNIYSSFIFMLLYVFPSDQLLASPNRVGWNIFLPFMHMKVKQTLPKLRLTFLLIIS